jgi:phenylalanyl-tRNA synthetase beta chain
MKYSLQWIREYLTTPLPSTDELVSLLSRSAFEVEEVVHMPSLHDTVLDIKVLPDRAHDALSHRGMAREIAALFDLAVMTPLQTPYTPDPSLNHVPVQIQDEQRSNRYIAVRVDKVAVTPSPTWLVQKLETIGARSINVLVDITNYVLFDMGQPMHVFDADKVQGTISVRVAQPGETMETLDGRMLTLFGTETVISDDVGVLALAGVKGGKKAEVTAETTSVIFESAHFQASHTRQSSMRHAIKTDASKRFENGIPTFFAEEGMLRALSLLLQLQPMVRISPLTPTLRESPPMPHIAVSHERLQSRLGIPLTKEEVSQLLKRVRCQVTHTDTGYLVIPPHDRLDLSLPEHVSEEVGRLYGYDRIPGILPPVTKQGVLDPHFGLALRMRQFLTERGYAEVFTYSFAVVGEGDVEVMNPVGKDRPRLRRHLTPGITRALEHNFYQAPLLGVEDIFIFEIGHVFHVDGERAHVALGVRAGTKKRAKVALPIFNAHIEALILEFGLSGVTRADPDPLTSVVEFDMRRTRSDSLKSSTDELRAYTLPELRYQSVSPFPFIARDIAMFVNKTVETDDIVRVLTQAGGPLLVRHSLFDRFEKEGDARVSYGYRLVFQSMERTLTDEEVLGIMNRVTLRCVKELGAEVR